MHALVRDLYRRFLVAGRDYPGGMEVVRRKAKEAFFSNAHLSENLDILKAVKIGRYVVRELNAVGQLKKYRSIRKSYYS